MSASTTLVSKFIAKFCPTLPDIYSAKSLGKPVFVVHKVTGTSKPTTRLFLRDQHAAGWDGHAAFSEILAACTPWGRKHLERVLTGRTESIFGDGNTYVTGPVALGASLRHNNAIQGGTMKARVKSIGTMVGQTPNGLNQIPGSAFDVSFRRALASVGFTDLSEWSAIVPGNAAPWWSESVADSFLLTHGTDRVYFCVSGDYSAGVATGHMWFSAKAWDDSFRLFTFSDAGGGSPLSTYLASDAYFKDLLRPELYIDSMSSLPEQVHRLMAFQSTINPALVQPSYRSGFGVQNHGAFTKIQALDWNWLPVLSVPREQDYFVRCDYNDIVAVREESETFAVVTVTMGEVDVLGAIPVKWYTEYAQERIDAGAANSDALRQAIVNMQEYQSKTITYCEMKTAVMLPTDIVTLTQTYQSYKKAKEKACEDNDFMEREFAPGITYGAVQTKINGSRNSKIFYGYRDSEAMPTIDGDVATVYTYTGWTVTLGSSVVTVRRSDGTFAPSLSNDAEGEGVAALVQMQLGGASLVGGTLESQLAIWGIPVNDVVGRMDGLGAEMVKIRSSNATGTSAALYDFRWASLGISGYPDYPSVDTQTQYRIAMLSKAILQDFGVMMRDLQLEEIQSAYVDNLLR